MKIIAIIQARMTSSRLAGKIIKNFSNNLNMLEMQLQTLQKTLDSDNIYIATTNNQQDNIIEEKYQHICKVYRGDEEDVLSRFLEITKESKATHIIRIASDNPFIFQEGIEYLMTEHLKKDADYTTFSIENKPSMLVPCGLYVEMIKASVLIDIEKKANKTEKEHVSYAIYTRLKNDYNVQLLPINNISSTLDNEYLRYTVDTPEDFTAIDTIINDLKINQAINLALVHEIIKYSQENKSFKQMKNESEKKKNSKNYG